MTLWFSRGGVSIAPPALRTACAVQSKDCLSLLLLKSSVETFSFPRLCKLANFFYSYSVSEDMTAVTLVCDHGHAGAGVKAGARIAFTDG